MAERTRSKIQYVFGAAWVVAYPILMGYVIHCNPSDMVFGVIGGSLFFIFYLVPFGLLQASIEATSQGVLVERWRRSSIAYSDVVGCYGLFWFPFQTAILITKQPFPLKIVNAGDEIDGRRRSLFQRGRLASVVTALKAAHDSP